MTAQRDCLLITGATGFIGHYLVRDLLHRARRCALVLRPPLDDALGRLTAMLEPLGVDVDARVRVGDLVPLQGDLDQRWPDVRHLHVEAIVHAAASTRFTMHPDGEPLKTNVEGTRDLLAWADASGIPQLHLISTAYVCGRRTGPVPEAIMPAPVEFHNVYEQSKWQAEAMCRDWSERRGTRLTIHRPSVVVGEFQSGRAIKFDGFHLSARATELLHRSFAHATDAERQAVPLRIEARPFDVQNIVPVDYVAACIAEIVCNRAASGRVFHLTHPAPPSNRLIKRGFESYFGIAGGRFVEPGTLADLPLNTHEQAFYDMSRSIGHYLIDTPTFDCANTQAVAARAGLACPEYDEAAIHRLVAYAVAAGWGRQRTSRGGEFSPCAAYFESFLPTCVSKSKVASMTALSTTMRFVIEDEPDGEWVCRFEEGRLRTVHRGSNGIREDFGYRSTREVFWEAIAGTTPPQELFLSGRAELFGDIERAMKMAAILHDFTREYPCDPKLLANTRRT